MRENEVTYKDVRTNIFATFRDDIVGLSTLEKLNLGWEGYVLEMTLGLEGQNPTPHRNHMLIDDRQLTRNERAKAITIFNAPLKNILLNGLGKT